MSDVDQLLASAATPEVPAGGETDVTRLLNGNSDATRLSYAMDQGAKIAPDKAARVLRLASETGLPHDLIERNPDEIEQAAKYAKFDAATFHHTSPITASWLSENPHQASIGGQDLPKLSFLERTLKAIGDPGDIADQFYRGRLSMQLYKIGEKAMLGTVTPEDRDLQARIEQRLSFPTDFNSRGFVGQIPGAIANQLPFFGQSFMGKAKTAAVGAGAMALTQGAGGAAIGSLAGPEGAAALGAQGLVQGGVEGGVLGWKYGAAVQDARIFGGLAYLDFEKMKDDAGNPLDRTTALGAATTVGVINGALGMIPFESMLKNVPVLRTLSQDGIKELLAMPTARQAFLTYAKHVGQAAALGGGVGFTQAMVQSAAGELAKMKEDGSIFRLSPGAVLGRIFSDANIEAATANAKMGLQAAGGTSAAAGMLSVHADLQRAKVGEAQAQAIKAVGDTAAGSEMLKTAPGQLQSLIARLTAGGKAENLYAPVDTWNQYFQGKNVDPREVAREVVGDTKSYDEALRNGTDIQIPTHKYATTLGAIPEHNAFFANELRADPTQMNGRESAEFMKTLEKTAGVGELTPEQQHGEAVVGQVRQQLEGAGFTPEIAATYADVYRAFGALGGRAGLDPLEFFKKYGLMISREVPGIIKEKGINSLDPVIDQLRAGEIPAEGEGQGKELLELLREKGIKPENEGSDLKQMDPDAELKPFQRKLLRPEGLTMDEAAELAQQQGYTKERSIPELIEKIDSSLRGEKQYAAGERNAGILAQKSDLEEFSRYLDSLGLDPQKMNNEEIKKALEEESAKAGSARTALEQARQTAGPEGSPEEPGKPESWRASTSLPRDLSSWDSSITGMVKNVKALFGDEPLGRDTETPEMLRNELLKLKATGLTEDEAILKRLEQLAQTTDAAVGITDRALKADDATRRTMLDRLNREIERRYMLNDEQPNAAVREAHEKLRSSLEGKTLEQPAYHGSGKEFDAFSLHHIGSGEGAWSYGWGLYFASEKKVAEYYADKLGNQAQFSVKRSNLRGQSEWVKINKMESDSLNHAASLVYDVGQRNAISLAKGWVEEAAQKGSKEAGEPREGYYKEILSAVQSLKKSDIKREFKGKVYTVDIPPDEQYLDWNKSISEQPEGVRTALEKSGIVDEFNKRTSPAGYNDEAGKGRGENLYAFIAKKLKTEGDATVSKEEKASRYLSELGIAGIKYPADQIDKGGYKPSSNYVVFDDKLVKILEHEQEGKEGEPRGRMSFGSNRQFNIELLKGADLSTFLHETGHFYLEVLGDLAQGDKATPEIQADYQTILKWLGAGTREEIKTEHHEKFARGFEAYLMEGKAPSAELRSTFARFRAWLVGVYRQVKSLNVELTPEVRQVFDRMLASDEEIKAAQREQRIEPLFGDPKAIGMNDTQANDYRRAIDEAQSAAEEQLAGKIMAEFNRARKAWWKERSAEARTNVAEDVNGRKEYVARAVLQTGKMPDGSELPEGIKEFKLDKKALIDAYGKEFLKRLPRSVYTLEDGVSPQAAAEAFGFRSGEELVMALANTQNRNQLIDAMTDQQMRETYGDMLTDGSVQVEAMKAVHNEKRGQLLQKELEYLASNKLPFVKEMVRRITRRIAPIEAVRDQAEDTIAGKAARDIIPSLYQKAESRSGREAVAAMLKGDFEAAFEAKQRELLNHELYRAAANAKDDIDLIVGYMSKFDKSSIREKLGKAGSDYLAQIDAIRERFDFRKGVSLKDIDQRKSLVQWVEEQRTKGYDVTVPQKLLNEAYTQHYKDTSYDELTGIRDAVKTIEHLANTKNVLLALAQARELGEARDQITGSIKAWHDVEAPIIDFAPGLKDRMYDKARGIAASHTRMEFLFEHLDGNNPHGPVWEALFNPFNLAQNREDDMMRETTKKINEIFGVYSRSERARWFLDKVHIPEIDDGTMTGYLNKANMLAVALNWGNLYNREALMRGYGWKENQVEAILKHLDARDWKTVQALWDHIDTYWAEAKKLEEDINGTAPSKVEAFPFDVHIGMYGSAGETINMRGGYYPIVFDNKLSWRQGQLDEHSSVKEMFGGNWARAMTRHGHLEERENTGGKPIRLELTGLTNHISNVIHDISFRREVIDAHRIINDPEIRQTISNAVGRDMYAQLNPWLHSIAGDRGGEYMNPIEGLLGRARGGATVVSLGLNVVTGIVHALGYSLAMKELGVGYASHGLADAWSQPWKLKDNWDFVVDRSDMMRQRYDTGSYDRDVRDSMKRLNVAGVQPGIAGAVDAYTMNMHRSFMGLIGYMDLAVSLPIWLGSYRKAMDGALENVAKGDEKAASEYADQVVRQTKSAGASKDLAMIQHGSQSWKLFTMFYSQMSLQFNQFEKTYNQFKLDRNVPKLLGSMALSWFVPAALDEIIRGRTPSVEDDDQETWTKWLLRKELLYPFHSVILLRDIAHALDKYVETGKPDFQGSPVFDVFNTAAKGASIPFKAAAGKEVTREDYKDAFNTVGYGFGLPTRQTWKTGEYVYDWMTGEETPSNPVEGVWRAAIKGKSKR